MWSRYVSRYRSTLLDHRIDGEPWHQINFHYVFIPISTVCSRSTQPSSEPSPRATFPPRQWPRCMWKSPRATIRDTGFFHPSGSDFELIGVLISLVLIGLGLCIPDSRPCWIEAEQGRRRQTSTLCIVWKSLRTSGTPYGGRQLRRQSGLLRFPRHGTGRDRTPRAPPLRANRGWLRPLLPRRLHGAKPLCPNARFARCGSFLRAVAHRS